MAGRLVGTLDGRPVVIDADDTGVTLVFGSLAAAWSARNFVRPARGVLAVLRRSNVAVRVKIAGLLTLDLLPRPSVLVRVFAPPIADPE